MNQTIALLTDFGLSDIYVGVMKGVMRGIHPPSQFVDISHAIQPQNVRQAAFALLNSYRYFPPGTVFLIVVDPGVGTTRRPLAAQAGDYLFVAPDNGVLSYVFQELQDVQIVELENPDYRLPNASNTFHGRDIFAPAAAHLAAGVSLFQLGSVVTDPMLLPAPELTVEDKRIVGELVHIDHFGNAVTSIGQLHWVRDDRLTLVPRLGDETGSVQIVAPTARILLTGAELTGIYHHYGEVGRGDLLAMVGSNGHLEISVNQGSAAVRLDLAIGDRVEVVIELPKTGLLGER